MEDYQKIQKYLINKNRYKEEYEILVRDEIYNFVFLTSWKTLILFCYEKIYQVRNLIGDDKEFEIYE